MLARVPDDPGAESSAEPAPAPAERSVSEDRTPVDVTENASRSRVEAAGKWLERRTDTPLGRLALGWFHRYFEASWNSASAAALYAFLALVPTVLAVVALVDSAGTDTNAFVEQSVDRLRLNGSSAELVRDTFGSATSNALAASAAAVVGFLVWGLGLGKIFQDVYARAWRIEVDSGSAAEQGRFAIWFFAVTGAVAVWAVVAEQLQTVGVIAVFPAWIAGSILFWLWTPRYLLHRRIGLRELAPGAVLAAFVLGGTIATSPLYIGSWVNVNGTYFGPFGVAIALLAGGLIFIAVALTCAVFSPVWVEWRASRTP
jgi:membrane protein